MPASNAKKNGEGDPFGKWTKGVQGLGVLIAAIVALVVTTILGVNRVRDTYKSSSFKLAVQEGVIVGEIRAFASSVLPDGWLEANGESYQNSKLGALHSAIGGTWGSDDTNCFNVPDLRGQFLRGWNHDRPKPNPADDPSYKGDPDADGREGGNRVGSIQIGSFRKHRHELTSNKGGEISNSNHASGSTDEHPDYARSFGAQTGAQGPTPAVTSEVGSNETRPVNSYVLFGVFAGPEASGQGARSALCRPPK